jgi:hypothetical protein
MNSTPMKYVPAVASRMPGITGHMPLLEVT